MALIDDFKARFPNLDGSLVDVLVPVYENNYSCYYGGSYDNDCDKEAILLLIAHLVVTDPSYSGDESSSRAIASQSVGSVSVSFVAGSTGSDWANWLNSTRYGQLFLMATSNNMGPSFA